MRNKDIQRELWREDKEVKSLEDMLRIIRAGDATEQQQKKQAVSNVKSMKCYNCDKYGHKASDCSKKSKLEPKSEFIQINRSCSFCGDPQKCRARDCKAYKYKCSKCNLFGHFDNYCCKGDDMASGSILNKLIQHIFTTNG